MSQRLEIASRIVAGIFAGSKRSQPLVTAWEYKAVAAQGLLMAEWLILMEDWPVEKLRLHSTPHLTEVNQ